VQLCRLERTKDRTGLASFLSAITRLCVERPALIIPMDDVSEDYPDYMRSFDEEGKYRERERRRGWLELSAALPNFREPINVNQVVEFQMAS